MTSVELFVGAGGLAMGVAAAGFRHLAVVEKDPHACRTLTHNQRREIGLLDGWPLHCLDVKDFDFRQIDEPVDLLAGGPPCQPFSLGGKHRGNRDPRNLFPEVVRAARILKPKAILIENVKGLLRSSFAEYFDYILLQLTLPEEARRERESWVEHWSRLVELSKNAPSSGLRYDVDHRLLMAADYGVPQRRERVFIIALRTDLGLTWSWPQPTHSLDSLVRDQWITGKYWDRHGIAKKDRPQPPGQLRSKVRSQKALFDISPRTSAWRTVRDAISDLPRPVEDKDAAAVLNHRVNPGARAYPGHTGSPLDQPAKTLKAGDHGVPGGENMIAFPDGTVRYFTVRESARLQTFPDEYEFCGSWTETMRQLGNAVPVALARSLATQLAIQLRPLSRGVSRLDSRSLQPLG